MPSVREVECSFETRKAELRSRSCGQREREDETEPALDAGSEGLQWALAGYGEDAPPHTGQVHFPDLSCFL